MSISKPEIIALYRRAHSWVGILAGLFLFIAFYAGTLTQFEEPLQNWAMSTKGLPAPVPLEQLGALRDQVLAENPKAREGFTLNLAPEGAYPSSMSWVLQRDRDRGAGLTVFAGFDEQGHTVLAQRTPPQGARFLNILHQRIGLPLNRAWGRPIMGIVAFLYAMALISGVIVMLPSLARVMFNMRLGQGPRKAWFDLHTLLGVFSLPFHIMIAVTALGFAFVAPLGMAEKTLFMPAAMTVSSAHQRQHGPDKAQTDNRVLLPPDALVALLKREVPDFTPTAFDYFPNAKGFRIMAVGPDATTVTRTARGGVVLVDPYNGRIVGTKDLPYHQNPAFLAAASVGGFHFGRFGGITGHIGMAFVSAVGSFLFYSGNQLWLASRRRKERAAGYTADRLGTRILSILSSGVMFGCIAGVSAVLVSMLIVPHAEDYARCEAIFYAVFLACILIACILGGERSAPWLMRLSGFVTVLIPIFDSVRHIQSGEIDVFSVIFDLLTLVYGVWLVLSSYNFGKKSLIGLKG